MTGIRSLLQQINQAHHGSGYSQLVRRTGGKSFQLASEGCVYVCVCVCARARVCVLEEEGALLEGLSS